MVKMMAQTQAAGWPAATPMDEQKHYVATFLLE
jgi:hypothetical protein